MNQYPVTSEKPAARAPVFFWISVALLGLLFLGGAAGALWLACEAKSINRDGGWGWLLVGAIYVGAIIVVCFACATLTTISLFRRESHRPLSIAILIISGLVVTSFGANLTRAVIFQHRQHAEAARVSSGAPQPESDTVRSRISPSADRSSNAPVLRQSENQQVLELKSKLWEAIRAKNADAFVDCFYIEQRFNTPEIRQENRNQVEILLKGETVDVEVLEIPARELAEILKIQRAKSDSPFRYSLDPGMMLRIWQNAVNGRVGRSFLIGEKNGNCYIITMAGHTT